MSVYDTAAITDVSIPVRTRAQRFRRRYGLATIGAVIVVGWLVIALFAPWLTSYSPDTVDVANPYRRRKRWARVRTGIDASVTTTAS